MPSIFKGAISLVHTVFVLKARILENLGGEGQGNLESFGALRFEEKECVHQSCSSDRRKGSDRMGNLAPFFACFPTYPAILCLSSLIEAISRHCYFSGKLSWGRQRFAINELAFVPLKA